jgi:hypothetical protein
MVLSLTFLKIVLALVPRPESSLIEATMADVHPPEATKYTFLLVLYFLALRGASTSS